MKNARLSLLLWIIKQDYLQSSRNLFLKTLVCRLYLKEFVLFLVGLLFCFDDPPITGRDGKRSLKNIVARGKNYHDMLYTLINDISIDPSSWYQCIAKVPAWAAFMERCFLADIEVIERECRIFARSNLLLLLLILLLCLFY